jgi:hypothetical protein
MRKALMNDDAPKPRKKSDPIWLSLALCFGGAAVIWWIFQSANPARAWNGATTATW